MTEAEFNSVEQALSVKLPASYRAVATGCRPNRDFTALLLDPTELVELNRSLREGRSVVAPWPERYFALGHDGGGNSYAIDLVDPENRVYWVAHKNISDFRRNDPDGTDLQQWLKDMVSDLESQPEEAQPKSFVTKLLEYVAIGVFVTVVLVVIALIAR